MLPALLLLCSAQTICPVYNCTSVSDPCGSYNPYSKTYSLGSCPSSQYCPSPSPTSNTTCQNVTASTGIAWGGEACNATFPCFGQLKCKDNRCSMPALDGNCVGNFDCGSSQFCGLDGVCDDLVEIGGTCTSDYECVQNAGCDVSITASVGVCTPYLSKAEGTPVANCASGFSLLCESSSCYESSTGAVCMGLVQSTGPMPVQCSANSICSSTVDPVTNTVLSGLCTCGFTSTGASFCPAFPGDSIGIQYLSLLRKWTQSKSIRACNTQRRLDLYCIYSNWDTEDYLQYAMVYYEETMYSLIQANSPCVREVYTSTYWNAQAAYQNYINQTHDGAGWMWIGTSLILVGL